MDLSFANQALAAEHLVAATCRRACTRCRWTSTARSRASSSRRSGVGIDALTDEQRAYLSVVGVMTITGMSRLVRSW